MPSTSTFFDHFETEREFYNWLNYIHCSVDPGFSFELSKNKVFRFSSCKKQYSNVFDLPLESYRLKTFCSYFYNRMRFVYGIETVNTSTNIETFFAADDSILWCNFFYTKTMIDLGLTLIILENPSKYYLVVAVDHYKNENHSHNLYHFDEPFCSSFSQAWISNEVKSILDHAKSNLMPQIVR